VRELWDAIKRGYLRLAEPLADYAVRRGISPNEITTLGTFCVVATGVMFAMGHIRTGGWILALTAIFDVLDGMVARRTGKSTVFGAFYDSTLDRVADGALLGGLLVFYASDDIHRNILMVIVALLGVIGAFLTSYTRARAEPLGIDAKVGLIQRAERLVLLAAPQAIFGLTLNGRVLMGIVVLLSVASWVTVVQRMIFVYRATTPPPSASSPSPSPSSEPNVADDATPFTGDRVVR
jgi:CDP-diacylglycerol--glycerol-3-phosphate 3-phosphatidyltransferase